MRLVRHALILGSLFGGIAIITSMEVELSWIDGVITFLITTTLYALAMVIPLRVYLDPCYKEPSCTAWGYMVGLGFIASLGSIVLLGWLQFPRGEWATLPPPPERTVEILDGETYMVFGREVWVRTESNSIYSLGCGNGMSCKWEHRDTLPESNPEVLNWCGMEPQHNPPLLWETPLDIRVDRFCGVDYTIETHYRLMEDGRFLVWSNFVGMGSFYERWGLVVGAVVLAMCASLVYGANMGKQK